MSMIFEKSRELEVSLKCDVLVAGGGIAGVAAALAAARSGARVTLVEREYMLGGLATLGLITIFLPLCDGVGNQVIYGIGEELLKLSIKHGYEDKYPKPWLENGTFEEKKQIRYEVQYNPHLFALETERLLLREGVHILYGTLICNSITENQKITHVVIENKSGRSAIEAKSFVDATGDADICKLSGAKTEVFKQLNVLANWYYYTSKGETKLKMLGFADIPDDEKMDGDPKPLIKKRFAGIDGEELSEMICLGHEQVLINFNKEQQNDPTHTPVTMPTIPQIRMTRRIEGAYTLSSEEMHNGFEDTIGMTGDWRKRGPVYEIPFSTLHGNDVKNLIVAGRCISVTDSMWDISRVIPTCAVTGQAAGVAAAMCNDFTSIDIRKLQKELENNGVKLRP